ncbi:RNase adapter RapZ [Croceicoccus mobilis]|uniref:Nucleotide-binding protein n=1 Tax=Croceicoccus mobilis TaxID=1703339 RepID=A0A916Z6H4_9SPHN|nr:RNase adapter RapZ [Croceicoccus mobilis]GGD77655.1 nucleotide-binding protein [Croceicoccus mobilis]
MDSESPDSLPVAPGSEAEDGQASHRPSKVLLVTGMLGAGKTTALRALEDLGWEPVDNFPVRLLPRLVSTAPGPGHSSQSLQGSDGSEPLAIGFDSRTRGFDPYSVISEVRALAETGEIDFTTLFLDCGAEELERRYNETRRRHPMAGDWPAAAGIAAERELVAPLRRWADIVVETTHYSTNDLGRTIRELFAPSAPQGMTVTVSSFGFSRGMPPMADLVFDMRFLDNPHWVDSLRPLTGRDQPVADHIAKDAAWQENFARIRDLVMGLLPLYEAQGKSYLHIAFGCTGGKHRSVFSAEALATELRKAGHNPGLLHRNLDSHASDLVEGGARVNAR